MSNTIRERIIAAFTTRAAALSTMSVLRAQRSIGESDAKFVSIWDGEEQAHAPYFGEQKITFPIAVECIWKHGATNPSISANALLGTVITTFVGAATDKTFGGLVDNIVLSSATPSYPQDGGNYTTLTAIFTITYNIVTGDPYTMPS